MSEEKIEIVMYGMLIVAFIVICLFVLPTKAVELQDDEGIQTTQDDEDTQVAQDDDTETTQKKNKSLAGSYIIGRIIGLW